MATYAEMITAANLAATAHSANDSALRAYSEVDPLSLIARSFNLARTINISVKRELTQINSVLDGDTSEMDADYVAKIQGQKTALEAFKSTCPIFS